MPRAQLSPDVKDEEGHTALMRAALEGRTRTVKTLLRKGADVNEQDRDGHTALMFAVINIHTDIVRALLDYGADVNARANDGCTPLILAACGGDTGIVQALLNKGADVKGKLEATGKTALMLAAEHGYTTIAELIEQAVANQ